MNEATQPLDLTPQAVRIARRIQSLRGNRIYVIIVTKDLDGGISLAVMEPEGAKVECCKGE